MSAKYLAFALVLFPLALLIGCAANAQGNGWPIANGDDRETPLHFGLYVTPDPSNNPIDPPERFTGYHAATDFEVSKRELKKEVPVYAVCAGKLHFSAFSEGYGGLVTQFCNVNGEDITALYGHLAVDSLLPRETLVGKGQRIGVLGAERSTDTDGNRKHLHFAILKGHVGQVLGYVQTEAELDAYMDPQTVLPF